MGKTLSNGFIAAEDLVGKLDLPCSESENSSYDTPYQPPKRGRAVIAVIKETRYFQGQVEKI